MLPLFLFGLLFNFTARGQEVCDVEESPLGNTYFRKITPWGQVIDLPCPSGTVFHLATCRCEKKRCLVLGSDPSVYKEFVDAVGDWVTGQCPGGMVYRDDYCMCTLPRDFSTRRPVTALVTVLPQDCPYRPASLTAYQEYFPSIEDWVTNYCPHGTVYIPKYCKCVTQATNTNEPETSTVPMTTRPPIKPPTNCKYVKDGVSSYKEYIDSLGDWLTYYCSSGEIFSTTWCTCLIEGQTPDYVDMLPPIVKDCAYQPAGLSAYIEYVPEINAWVTNECASKQVYSQAHCSCLNKDLVHVTTIKPKPTSPPVTVTNPNCDLKPIGQDAYQKFEESVQDWVTISCHAGMVFNVLLCHCVQEGVVVTALPESTTVHDVVTNPNCPYIPVGQRSYKEYVPDLGVWVSNDCPSEMVFDVNMCSCHPDGSAEIIVVPITTVPPLTIPTVKDCPHTKSPDGYNEYIAELNIWINNVCPVNHEFVKLYCTCLSRSDIAKIPKATTSTISSTTTTATLTTSDPPTTPSMGSTSVKLTIHPVQTTKYTTSTMRPTTSMSTTTMAPTTSTKKLHPMIPQNSKETTSIPSTTTTTRTTTKLTRTSNNPQETLTPAATTSNLPTTISKKPITTTGTTSKLTRTTTKLEPTSTTLRLFSTTTPSTSVKTTYSMSTSKSSQKPTITHLLETTRRAPITTTGTTMILTTLSCEKRKSALGERYYEKTVPVWGELVFMCSTGKIFYMPKCDCVSVSDIPTTTEQSTTTKTTPTQERTSETSTSTSTSKSTTTSTTKKTQPTLTTTTASTSTTSIPTTSTTVQKTTATGKATLCPLKPSLQGSEYFEIDLGTLGSIELKCPALQKFDPELCGCYPD